MNNVRRVAKNALALSAMQGSRILLGVAMQVYIARELGVAGLGKYAIILAFLNIFQVVANLGLPSLIVREAARTPQELPRYLYGALWAQFAGALAAWSLLLLVATVMRYPADTTRLVILSGASLFPRACSSACQTIMQAEERMEFITLAEWIGNAAQLALAIWLISTGHGVAVLVPIVVVPQIVIAVFSVGVVWRLGWFASFQFDLRFSWRLVRLATDFYLLSLAVVIFSRLDILFISKFLGERATGIYNAAYQVVHVFNLGAASYSQAIYPALSRLFRSAPDRFAAVGRRALRYGLIAILPVVAGTAVLARPIIELIYGGAQYVEAAPVLQILIWLCIPFLISALLSRLLLSGEQQRASLQIALIRLVAAGLYFMLLTPIFQIHGAAVATLVSIATGAVLNWYFVVRRLAVLEVRSLMAKPLIAALGMAAVVLSVSHLGLALSVGIGAVIYLLLLLILRTFDGEDWLFLRQLAGLGETVRGRP